MLFRALLIATLATGLMSPALATAPAAKHRAKITVYPKRGWHGYGFLPGYRPQPALSDWRAANRRQNAPELRYWRVWGPGWWDGQLQYGYGYPGFYRGQWNGGSFGPCWTQTPIGPQWNCGK